MIIGLGNKARQGKDEVGKRLAQKGFKVLHFADAVKEECAKYFGWTSENKNVLAKDVITQENFDKIEGCSQWRVTKEGVEFMCDDDWLRGVYLGFESDWIPFGDLTLLQWWGTEFRRRQDNDYWVKQIIKKYAENNFAPTVVCDMRFPNEAEMIKNLKGYTVKIQRIKDGKQFISDDRDPKHVSEIALDNYKYDLTIDIAEVSQQLMADYSGTDYYIGTNSFQYKLDVAMKTAADRILNFIEEK